MKKGSHIIFHARTPQQNGVTERKNRTLQEMTRTILNESNVKKYFWVEAINTFCYIKNCVSIRKILNNTPYDSQINRKANISNFHIFGSHHSYIFCRKKVLLSFYQKNLFSLPAQGNNLQKKKSK